MKKTEYLWDVIKTPCFVDGGLVQQYLKGELLNKNRSITTRDITNEESFGYERGWDDAMLFVKKQLIEKG